MENENQNPSKVSLTVTRTEPVKKTQEQLDDELRDMMQSDISSHANAMVFDEVLKSPMISNALNQAITFLPMVIKKGEEYFGKDKVRIMVYMDELTGALVIQKMYTDNIEQLKWFDGKEPDTEKDFFIITRDDLNNPKEFIKEAQKKLNLKLF